MENIIINIDSKFRNKMLYPNSGHFTYKLSEKIKNCKYIRLSSIELPNLYFTFTQNKKNTFFSINTNNATFDLKISDGMYDYEQLLNSIQNKLNEANCLLHVDFTILFNPITGFVTIESNKPFTILFDNQSPLLESLGYSLGFRRNTYTSNIKNVNGNEVHYITSESQLDSTGDHYLFLKINDYGVVHNDFDDIPIYDPDNPNVIIDIKRNQGKKNLFAKIIIPGNKTEQIFDNGSNFITKSYIFKQLVDINKFDFELIDSRGDTIDMLQMNYSLTLEIGIVVNSNLKQDMTDDIFNNFNINGPMFNPSINRIR